MIRDPLRVPALASDGEIRLAIIAAEENDPKRAALLRYVLDLRADVLKWQIVARNAMASPVLS